MGILDSVFGGGNQKVETKVKLPGYAEDYLKELAGLKTQQLGEATRIYNQNTGYPTYPGQRIADFSTPTRQAFNWAQAGRDKWSGPAQQASYLAGKDPTVVGNRDDIRRLMDPYLDQVLGRTLGNMGRENERLRLAGQARAGAANAYGGSRHAVADAMREDNYQRQVGDVTAGLSSQAYNNAVGTLQGDLQRQLAAAQTAAGVAGTRAGLERGYMQDLLGIGGIQEGKQQQSLDLGYQDFLQQRDYPWQQLGIFSNVLNDQPYNPASTATQQSTQPGPSAAQQLGGLGVAGLGLWRLLQ